MCCCILIDRYRCGLFNYHSLFFLLKGEDPPVCIPCDEMLTTEHMLITCSDFIETRQNIAQLRIL